MKATKCLHCRTRKGDPERRGLCQVCSRDPETLDRYPRRRDLWAKGKVDRRPMCCRCSEKRANRPRGLCWNCYYTPGVKELYPSTSKYARRGVGNFTGNAPLAPFPTSALPGTPEKMAVMAERAKNRQSIFHPSDAQCDGGRDRRDMLAVMDAHHEERGAA